MTRALRQDDVFAAISHPARRAVLVLLRDGAKPASALAAPFKNASLPAVSQHLKVLRDVGLVREHREGRQRIYELQPAPLFEVYDWIKHYDKFWAARLETLGDFLTSEHDGDGGKNEEN